MQVWILAGIIGVTALLLSARVRARRPPPELAQDVPDIPDSPDFPEHLEPVEVPELPELPELPADAGTITALAGVLGALRVVMEHPQLGGPGFLTVQFPLSRRGLPEVSAQYPNIRETLYRRIIRGELEPEDLIRNGMPEELFARRVEFTAESGGMVTLAVEMKTEDISPGLEKRLAGREGHGAALRLLAGALGERFPDMTVRAVGWDLLLTPRR